VDHQVGAFALDQAQDGAGAFAEALIADESDAQLRRSRRWRAPGRGRSWRAGRPRIGAGGGDGRNDQRDAEEQEPVQAG
jgi:hypothetical protein